MAENVVVVESPAKARTINKYLGSDYKVLASFGHVRDLPAKNGSVAPDRDFSMEWEVDRRGRERLDEVSTACKGARRLFLATDPDREGEAISWHIREELDKRKLTKNLDIQRVVFNEISKKAVLTAFASPRALDQELIDAYLARRALDYLVGFTLSPVLWRKLPGARSAGRVQSVALRLICERESEIEQFRSREYWTVTADLTDPAGSSFQARLVGLDGRKLDKFDLPDEKTAKAAGARVKESALDITSLEKKEARRNPAPPFITSTLQQEASRKLGFGASRTMSLAQKLYEGVSVEGETVGLITYMRTDSPSLSNDALAAVRQLISTVYGENYLPRTARLYKTKAKNAQEAHEAIRPVSIAHTPERVAKFLDPDMAKLYGLIWKRTVASQMESAVFDRTIVSIASADRQVELRANGQSLRFDGFLKVYREGIDDAPQEDSDDQAILPPLNQGDKLGQSKVEESQHFTDPPPRYSEASLVKKMEELGIGRPSTYASILKVLQDRDYVRLEAKRFFPEDRGRLVTAFLNGFFEKYVDYGFTAGLEESLDDISGGRKNWRDVLTLFWRDFKQHAEDASSLSFSDVRTVIDQAMSDRVFPVGEDGDRAAARQCPACADGRLSLNFGRYGTYVACSNYPDCKYSRNLDQDPQTAEAQADMIYPYDLGADENGQQISLRKGPYGLYIQRDLPAEGVSESGPESESDPGDEKPEKPKKKAAKKTKSKAPKPDRVGIPKGMSAETIDLGRALQLLSLPRHLGDHPETQAPIKAGIGRYGPYLLHQGRYTSLPADEDVLTIGLNRAMALLEAKKAGSGGDVLGLHPNGGNITRGQGRYGPYVKHGSLYASIPKSLDPESLSLEQAIELINARAAKGKSAPKKGAKPRGRASKK